MKITPSMIEAGVGAMARIKKQHPVDESVVATVFSAMYAALEREQKRLAGTLVEKKYEHQDWPAWRYGPEGESEVFATPEDVPEGWTERPGGVPAVIHAKRRGRPPKVQDGTETVR